MPSSRDEIRSYGRRFEADDATNLRAVEIMGDLHDALEAGGYSGHELERLLVRILFCLFAEDTGIFERDSFKLFLENHTKPDGSDLGPQIAQFFQTLNTPENRRQSNLLEELAALPYVNGELFAKSLAFAAFNRDMRNRLLACAGFNWSRISPAVFGALFQSIMEPSERRQIGAHYTSERDILKVVGPLFLDELHCELEKAGNDRRKLRALHERMGAMRLLDPACGCGNFLVVSYRELRLLELEILDRLNHRGEEAQKMLHAEALAKIDVDQMYGIEIEEWPARIAEVAMWLMDHQMNLLLSESFGTYYVRLPLRKSPHICHGNALTTDWNDVLPAGQCTHVLGNPPFGGAKYQTKQQRKELAEVAKGVRNAGLLDYVTGWYLKAAKYIENTRIPVAFVSTNSITQGEQVGVLWGHLLERHGVSIHFAHRTFAWESEARGKAHVHVVIIGFGMQTPRRRRLFEYECVKGGPHERVVSGISPYLVEGPDVTITNRSTPLRDVPEIGIGNKPIDDGSFLFTDEEKAAFVKAEPASKKFFRRWYGSQEFINGSPRWCLWLEECPPNVLRTMPAVVKRVKAVREFRLRSKSTPTQKLAERPTRFHVENMPKRKYLVIPKVSSERRRYIPMGFMQPKILCSDLVFILPGATLFHFGVLTSAMHMAWVRQVAGRLKSDYRYSVKLVYNNFPWPEGVTSAKRRAVEQAARKVLDVREKYSEASLADLYDPLSMPTDLVKAHAALDRAVDRCYRSRSFSGEVSRVEYLFQQYQRLASPLTPGKTMPQSANVSPPSQRGLRHKRGARGVRKSVALCAMARLTARRPIAHHGVLPTGFEGSFITGSIAMGTRLDRREFLQNTTAGMLSAAVLSTAGAASFAQQPEKKPVRIGVIGTGPRGRWHITNMLTNQKPIEVTAICDIKPAALAAGVDVVKKLSGKEPATYSKNETDYLNLCQRDDVDAVLAAVPSKWLGRMSIDAMKAGKHAAHEVPGCYTIEECWEMVETKEKSGKHCMMLENCCYGEDNMQIMHMIRQDVFGEPYFGEGSYIHDCRHYLFDSSGKITWRGELVRDAYGSSYNPHGLGSPSKWLGINDGDRFESCVCMMSRPKEAHAYCVAKFGADSEPAKVDFKLGDFVSTLIQTALGRQVRVDYALTSTRPYSRYYLLQGMKGCYDSRTGLYLGPGGPSSDKWGTLAEHKEKYQNPYWKEGAAKAKAAGGHGGIDYFVIQDFVKMVREDKEPWIDVYDAAAWASILHFSKLSLDRGGAPVKVDDFTRDKWKDPNRRKAQWV